MTSPTVTFDTNVLWSVTAPDTAQRATGADGVVVRKAIQEKRIHGFFSETLLTLEGIQRKDRADILGQSRVVSSSESTGQNSVTLIVGVRHRRKPFDPKFSNRVRAAYELGLRPLQAPARIGVSPHLEPAQYPLYEPPGGIHELVRCMDKVNELAAKVAARGVGQARAVECGLQLSRPAGIIQPELWLQGLRRASTQSECKRVAKVVAEWADGDSIAAHYGFGIDLFCSEDFGKAGNGNSILGCDNRQWLSECFGIRFVSLAELAKQCRTIHPQPP